MRLTSAHLGFKALYSEQQKSKQKIVENARIFAVQNGGGFLNSRFCSPGGRFTARPAAVRPPKSAQASPLIERAEGDGAKSQEARLHRRVAASFNKGIKGTSSWLWHEAGQNHIKMGNDRNSNGPPACHLAPSPRLCRRSRCHPRP